jgi:DNA-binding NarL/FixJ family response regulator
VWVVEDKAMLREGLAELLDAQPDMRCALAVGTCEDFLAALDAGDFPDVVLMDIGLPGRSGIEGVARIRSLAPAAKVIILTIHAEDEKVFQAICAGASGYLLKPSAPDRVVAAIREVERGAAPINAFIARRVLAMFARMAPPAGPDAADADYGLTPREREILQYLVDGWTLRQIAGELHLSFHTIDNHVRAVYRKLHVRSRSAAVAKALREDLV